MRLVQRLFITYLFIVIAILAILALILSRSLSSFVFSQQQDRLLAMGRTASEQAAAYLTGATSLFQLSQTAQAIDQSLNARVWILDRSGRVILDSRSRGMHMRGSHHISSQYLEILWSGEEISRVTDLVDQQGQILLAGIPVSSQGKIVGGVLLMTPVSDVQAALSSVYRLFWPAAGLSLVVALLLAMLVSRSISHPLQELSDATKQLADGNFSSQVRPRGDRELRVLAESFNAMAGQLKELDDMRRDLVASVSHELRSPLTSIRGFVQGVIDGKVPPTKQKEYLQRSLDEIRRLSTLIENLLELSALEGKAAPIEMSETDLREIINLSLASMEPQLTEHQMQVEVNLPDYPLLAMADPSRMQQVLVNIISNSIRHTPPGAALTISGAMVGGECQLRLTDTGPGIPGEKLPYIFKPFYHGREGGTGLGLSIARALVEAQNGSIQVRNKDGAEFIIKIPGRSS